MSWIEKITFQQTFPTGSFQNQKLGIEIAFDRDAEHEDAVKVYQLAKDLVNEAFQKMNPQLEGSQNRNYSNDLSKSSEWTDMPYGLSALSQQRTQPIPTKDISEDRPYSTEERIIDQIESCTDLVVLESFRLLAKKNPHIWNTYQSRKDFIMGVKNDFKPI